MQNSESEFINEILWPVKTSARMDQYFARGGDDDNDGE